MLYTCIRRDISFRSLADRIQREDSAAPSGRNPDGTFTKGSEAAKEAGHIGGLHAAGKEEDGEKDSKGDYDY